MFKRTGYFNPTGFRRTISSYAPVIPQQAANRFVLEYVPSYVPPPPPPPPAPVINNSGGGDNNVSGPGSYQIGNTGTFKQMNYNDHHSSGIHDGGNDHGGWNDDSSNFGAHDSFAKGGTIPPMYANQGMAMPGIPEKGVPSNVGTVSNQQRSSFDKGQAVGYTDKGYGTVMNALSVAPAMAKGYVDKEIDIAKENPFEAAVKALTNFGVTKGLDIKAFSPQAFVASAIINGIFDSQYDGLLDGPNSEVDMSANNTSGYTSNPSQMDASSHPSFGNIKDALNTTSLEVDAAINDIATDMVGTPPDDPTDYGALSPEDVGNMSSNTSNSNNTPSDPPSSISDHANVHGPDPSPATPDMGTDFGEGYNSADDNPSGNNSSGATGGSTSMGPGSGMHGPGDMGGGMQGGADDAEGGAGAGMGGPGDGTWSKGGRIYASQGGYVNSTGGK